MTDGLICFVKYPQPGQVKTRLAEALGAEHACALYRDLAERVITEVYPLDGRYELIIFCDPRHEEAAYQAWLGDAFRYQTQVGETLGDRLAHAFDWAFDEVYDRVIVVGSDCIGMDEAFIGRAFSALEKTDVVLGPSSDGGYYLVGMRQAHRFLFEDMAWSEADVYQRTMDRIEARLLKASVLEERQDIDTLDDLTVFRQNLPQEHFLAKKIDRIVLENLATKGPIGDES